MSGITTNKSIEDLTPEEIRAITDKMANIVNDITAMAGNFADKLREWAPKVVGICQTPRQIRYVDEWCKDKETNDGLTPFTPTTLKRAYCSIPSIIPNGATVKCYQNFDIGYLESIIECTPHIGGVILFRTMSNNWLKRHRKPMRRYGGVRRSLEYICELPLQNIHQNKTIGGDYE